jgi:hypothetical protein
MSDRGPSFGSGFAGETGNPVSKLLVAIGDAWSVALSGLSAVAGQAGAAALGPRALSAGGDPVAALIAAMTSFSAAMGEAAAQAAGSLGHAATASAHLAGATAQPAIAQDAELAPLMARAAIVAATSTLNYWRSLADVYARHQASLLQFAAQRATGQPPAGESERRVLADELRAYFREVGEVAVREARRLHAELEQIGEAVARATEQPDTAAPHQRHWKAKE